MRAGSQHAIDITVGTNTFLRVQVVLAWGIGDIPFMRKLQNGVGHNGAAATTLEFWVEPMVQFYKAYVKSRAGDLPELVFFNDLLCRRRLAQLRCNPQLKEHCLTQEELRERARPRPQQPPQQPPDQAAGLMVGPGVYIKEVRL